MVEPKISEGFSWKLALKHAGYVALLVIGLGMLPLFLVDVADPRKLGEGVGRFVAFSGLMAYAASYGWQTGKTKLAYGLVAAWSIIVLGTIAAISIALMD